jgi:hypothetical protein
VVIPKDTICTCCVVASSPSEWLFISSWQTTPPTQMSPHMYVNGKVWESCTGPDLLNPNLMKKLKLCTDPSSPICHEITWGTWGKGKREFPQWMFAMTYYY